MTSVFAVLPAAALFGEALLAAAPHPLASLNALLNASATVLLIVGWALIKRRHETAHRNVMLAAFGVSCAFLASYLTYHLLFQLTVPFAGPASIRRVYIAILVTHVVLAATVPFLAIVTIYLGLRDRRLAHRRLARWTFPIWLYVSVTGVVIYLLLYHLYPGG
jgi:uncharacterized membrane protein YozB (DUF420 family)